MSNISLGFRANLLSINVKRICILLYFFSHGFINGNVDSEIDLEVLRRREQKWLHMSNNWDNFMVHHYKKVRSRCRKGIPPATRPRAWFYLCGAKYMMEDTGGTQVGQGIDTGECRENQTKFDILCVSFLQYCFKN